MLRFKRPWLPVYEGDDPPVEPVEPPEGGGTEPPVKPKSKAAFTPEQQEQVNKLMADEKRKLQLHTTKALEELEAVKARSDLTAQERTELETRLEDTQASLKTAEELARNELDSLRKKLQTREQELEAAATTWEDRFKSSTIERSILDAATAEGQEAFSTSQIIAIVGPLTRLTEEKDADGKTQYKVMTKLPIVNEKHEVVNLDLPVLEAVKKMSEMQVHANLFKASTASGLGLGTVGAPQDLPLAELAKNPAEFRKKIKEEGVLKK